MITHKINLNCFSAKYDIPIWVLRAYLKGQKIPFEYKDYYYESNENKTSDSMYSKWACQLNKEQYSSMKEYFFNNDGHYPITFYTPGEDRTRLYKNVIKLEKTDMCNPRYQWVWYQYTTINGVLEFKEISRIANEDVDTIGIWRPSPDSQYVVIVNENEDFEAFSKLPTSQKEIR